MESHRTKLSDEQLAKLRELLQDQHTWPTDYLFKFIVPAKQVEKVRALFPHNKVSVRQSTKGKYVALTVTIWAESPDLVIAVYQKASDIEGLISL
jgi:uncharacterized protein